MSQKIVILGTGGTIAGVASSALQSVHYQAAQLSVVDLLRTAVSQDRLLTGFVIETEQVLQLDSKDFGFSDCVLLTQRVQHYLQQQNVVGVVITHGTDTLEETAFFLSMVLPNDLLRLKSVVLTCAMRPATSMLSDGAQNICDALLVAADARSCGVLAVCAGKVHAAEYVQKVHTYRLDAFESVGASPLGFVEDGQVRWVISPLPIAHCVTAIDVDSLHQVIWPRVEIVMNYIGADGAVVRTLCDEKKTNRQALVQGLVVAGTGNGTLSKALEEALLEAQSHGVRVLRCSRCAEGQVVQAPDATPLLAVSPVSSTVKARIFLMLSLVNAISYK